MNIKKLLSSLLASLMLVFPLSTTALADPGDGGTPSPTPPADTTPPTTAITSPVGGTMEWGTFQVTATASDDVGVTEVDLYAGNTEVASTTTLPAVFNWDSTKNNGTVVLTTHALDAGGNVGVSTPVSIILHNPTGVVPAWAFNDATGTWVATTQSSFSWNPYDQQWESALYTYNPVTGYYHVIPPPPPPVTPPSTSGSGLSTGTTGDGVDPSTAATLQMISALLGLNDPSVSGTGPGSTNTGSLTNSNLLALVNLSNGSVLNNNTSNAQSGDATATGNTQVGNVTSGDASTVNNLVNLLSSLWSWSTGGLTTFMDNLVGNQTGNILLQPTSTTTGGGQLGTATGGANSVTDTGPDSTNSAATDNQNDTTVVNQSNGSITNNVNAGAQSGDATANGDTQVGNVGSGDAATNVNIINLINSLIGANQSFLGVINILGNLNGNILFPTGFLDGSVPSQGTGTGTATTGQTGPSSTNDSSVTDQNTTNLNNTTTDTANNNIQANAQSGSATASGDTSTGNVGTGSANTNTNTYNLANTNIVGTNAVLVLVNVLGTWFGAIMNEPATNSSSSALLTDGATATTNDTGPGSTNSATNTTDNNTNVTNTNTNTITNNVNATAASGDAAANGDTSVGNVTSGNAGVASNVANLFGSSLNLSNWFGVLVINVFGSWIGNVGVAPAAGEGGTAVVATTSAVTSTPGSAPTAHPTGSGTQSASTSSTSSTDNQAVALNAQNVASHGQPDVPTASVVNQTNHAGLMFLFAAGFLLLAAGLERLRRRYLPKV